MACRRDRQLSWQVERKLEEGSGAHPIGGSETPPVVEDEEELDVVREELAAVEVGKDEGGRERVVLDDDADEDEVVTGALELEELDDELDDVEAVADTEVDGLFPRASQ